jgi:ribosomal protein L11 methyltransferase
VNYGDPVPYRVDVSHPPADALDRLVTLGALDIEPSGNGLAAILPDGVTPAAVATALGVVRVATSEAIGRDDGSVWILSPRAVSAGGLVIAPHAVDAPPGALRLTDAPVFGSGLHPTTALCLASLDEIVIASCPDSALDVGTGSGVLALAALLKGVPRAVGLDTDAGALAAAAEHARLNRLGDRLTLVQGGPGAVEGSWPLVLANVLAAPLIEMAPVLVRRVAHGGELVLSGIPRSVAPDVERAYRRLGMRLVGSKTRAGWTALIVRASW